MHLYQDEAAMPGLPVRVRLGMSFGQAAGSGERLDAGVAPDRLRRLTEGAQEGAAHALAVGETRLGGDDVDRVPALLHHQPRGFDAKMLDRLGGRLAGLGAEGAAELPRAEMSGIRELLDGQRQVKVAPG